MIQLTDLIEEPINLYDPHFQQKITADRQFSSLNQIVNKIERGSLFPHQEFNRRYLRLYPSLIIIDEPGTGKTCAVTGFAEYAFDQYLLSLQNNFAADERVSNLRRTILLVKGKTQENEFRNQLLCNCTTRYEKILKAKDIENSTNNKSESSKKSAITSVINNWYDIYGYHKFMNYILKKYPEFLENENQQDRAAAEYDDTIFWIDEAHNLINLDKEIKNDKLRDKRTVYKVISTILQKAKRIKIVISTATPATNNANDFTSVFNLALPANGKLPEEFNVSKVTILDLLVHLPQVTNYYLKDFYNMSAAHRLQYVDESLRATITTAQLDNLDTWFIASTYNDYLTITLAPIRQLDRKSIEKFFVGQIPDDYDYTNANLPVLNSYLRGRITYVRTTDSAVQVINKTNVNYTGVQFPVKLQLFYSLMSDFQTYYYNVAYTQSKTKNDGVYNSSRQASTMVYPDGTWGDNISVSSVKGQEIEINEPSNEIDRQNELFSGIKVNKVQMGYRKYITVEKNGNIVVNNELRNLIIPTNLTNNYDLSNIALENIRNYSSIYYEIIKNILQTKGNVFVYADDMVYGSGIIALAAFLEIMGYERMREKTSIFAHEEDKSSEKDVYCAPDEPLKRKNRRIRSNFPMKKRYAILTGETSKDFSIIMEAMNSYANRHGDYIQVLITSRVGRDGINVYNVLAIHIIPFAWNYAAIYQSIMRGLRVTSHYDLIEEEESVQTGIFLHAAIPNNYIYQNNQIINKSPEVEPINVKMYMVSEEKDAKIKYIMRMLKQLAVSCQINLARNIRPASYNNTPLCDYQDCTYQCLELNPKKYNYHNYDILYAQNDILATIDNIRIIFTHKSIFTYAEIVQELDKLQSNQQRYLLYALERINRERIEMLDSYGFPRYLHNQGNIYFLSEKYPSGLQGQVSEAWYDTHLTALQHKSFANITYQENIEAYNTIIQTLTTVTDISSLLNTLNVDLQVYILEQAILQVISNTGQQYNLNNRILDHYKQYWYYSHEPYSELIKSANTIAEIHLKSGQKAVDQYIRAKNYTSETLDNFIVEDNSEIVYWHNLYLITPNQAKYANSSQFDKGAGRIRILKRSDGVYNIFWRETLDYEYSIYNLLIQKKIKSVNEEYRKHKLYGVVLDGVFKIVDVENEKENLKNKKDKRYLAKGKACKSWPKFTLFNFLYRLQTPVITADSARYSEQDRVFLANRIHSFFIKSEDFNEIYNYSLDKLVYLNNLIVLNMDVGSICALLRQRFTELNRMRH